MEQLSWIVCKPLAGRVRAKDSLILDESCSSPQPWELCGPPAVAKGKWGKRIWKLSTKPLLLLKTLERFGERPVMAIACGGHKECVCGSSDVELLAMSASHSRPCGSFPLPCVFQCQPNSFPVCHLSVITGTRDSWWAHSDLRWRGSWYWQVKCECFKDWILVPMGHWLVKLNRTLGRQP